MTIGNETTYQNFNYSLNANKLLNISDGDIDVLLKLYNVTSKALEEMVTSIREWYEKQPHLPQGQLHDRMILGHLITRGFSVEQSKEKIDNYFSAKNRMPEILGGRVPLPPNVAKCTKQGYWIISPTKTVENHRVIVFRIMDPDMVVLDVVKLGFIMGDYRLFNETTQGDHWVFDFSNATLNQAIQLTPLLVSKIYYHVTSCYALKMKGLHLVNVPTFGHTILALFKKIMKSKHLSRLHLYDGFENVFKVLPREVFPRELGGTSNISVQEMSDTWCETIQSETWTQFFVNQDKNFWTDESKRIIPSTINDSFGVEGSFRKLELD